MVEEVVAEAVDLGILLLLLLYLHFRAVPGRQISSHGIPFPRPDREQIGGRFNVKMTNNIHHLKVLCDFIIFISARV